MPQEYFRQRPEHAWNLIELVTLGTGTSELPGIMDGSYFPVVQRNHNFGT